MPWKALNMRPRSIQAFVVFRFSTFTEAFLANQDTTNFRQTQNVWGAHIPALGEESSFKDILQQSVPSS